MTAATQADRAAVRRLGVLLGHGDGDDSLPTGQATTREYAAAMARGDAFPAIKCALRPDGSLEIRDGRHRPAASMLAGRYGTALGRWCVRRIDELRQHLLRGRQRLLRASVQVYRLLPLVTPPKPDIGFALQTSVR